MLLVPPKAFTNTVSLSSASVAFPVGKPSVPTMRYPAPAPAPTATEELMAVLVLLRPVKEPIPIATPPALLPPSAE